MDPDEWVKYASGVRVKLLRATSRESTSVALASVLVWVHGGFGSGWVRVIFVDICLGS